MTAFSLYLPERRGLSRWTLAGATILAAYAAMVASLALWYAREPAVQLDIIPAIAVTLAPVAASSPDIQNQDVAVGPAMQQADAAAPKEERRAEEHPVERVDQTPPQPQAEVKLPPKEKVEKPEPQPTTPAPETRALPKNDRAAEFNVAGSNAYNALIFGHLQRFKRYPVAAHGTSGTVMVQFDLDRAGVVVSSKVTKSSGNQILDREALDVLRRASPFPAFPAAKPGTQDSFLAPINFGH